LAILGRRGGRFVARNLFIILAALAILTGAVFAINPALDMDVAAFFHHIVVRPEMSGFMRLNGVVRVLSSLVVIAAVIPAAVTLLMKGFAPKRPTLMSSRSALFLLLTLALGPGLLVNGLLKEGWARPRPGMVTEFGGGNAFVPWWDPRGTCDTNCSFVSGETSSATWLVVPALLAPPPWRYLAFAGVGVYGAAIALLRVMTGGHFLSDVIFAAIFTGMVIWLVHAVLYRWSAHYAQDDALDGVLAYMGAAILRAVAALLPSRGARPDKLP
jgi:lipid A 4'-phosphatase